MVAKAASRPSQALSEIKSGRGSGAEATRDRDKFEVTGTGANRRLFQSDLTCLATLARVSVEAPPKMTQTAERFTAKKYEPSGRCCLDLNLTAGGKDRGLPGLESLATNVDGRNRRQSRYRIS